ncbi:MAG: tetraacyldisaccharide 4'-kinase [Chitinophagaceae bacterium]|nr:tetraacyldisaccharide 4'-kinase [Chitinophagaceae bacterium]
MNFNSFWLKILRILLFPVAVLYGIVIRIRNYLYDNEIFQPVEFNFPIICIGNLSVGGTGKSPMVEYLVKLLMPHYKTATLSRGYKRKTRGYAIAGTKATALDIGDEPMQFHLKFPEITVAVGEERAIAIPQLLFDRPDTEVIILDDAMQHRAVKAGLNILLTDYNHLFTGDFFFPTGRLRDSRSSYKRADMMVVTKCVEHLSRAEKEAIIAKIKPLAGQHIFFTGVRYGMPYHILSKNIKPVRKKTEVLLVCGIANPEPLKEHLRKDCAHFETIYYRDHYIFTIDDLREIKKKFAKIKGAEKIILVTEKDAVRLVKFADELKDMPMYVQPIETYFLFNESRQFDYLIKNFIESFKTIS